MRRDLDDDGWPTVSTADFKALFWFLAFAFLFVAITSTQ